MSVDTSIEENDRVETQDGLVGFVKYVGKVPEIDSEETYVGIELDDPVKFGNDGSVKNQRYFNTNSNQGYFVPIDRVNKVDIKSFYEPQDTVDEKDINQEEAARSLQRQIRRRPSQLDLVEQGIVPANYFADPAASTSGQKLIREMVTQNLNDFYQNKRQTEEELMEKHIIPLEYLNQDAEDAEEELRQKKEQLVYELENKIGRRPTIVDMGEMHIIPRQYVEMIMGEAMTKHNRIESRTQYVQNKLEKHIESDVAGALAETFVRDEMDKDNEYKDEETDGRDNNEEDDYRNNVGDDSEWQVSFTYEPMANFQAKAQEYSSSSTRDRYVREEEEMSPTEREQRHQRKLTATENLSRHLQNRPSQQQIEVWGVVPPSYFDNPEQSLLRQALGREIALDMLESFFPERSNVEELAERRLVMPEFIAHDFDEAVQVTHEKKRSIMDTLNAQLDPRRRPSISDLGENGIIPENWLLDLYGLADNVRKNHNRMESAVNDLSSQLNVPTILANVVARDVLEEIESLDPKLRPSDEARRDEEERDIEKETRELENEYNALYHEARGSRDLNQEEEEKRLERKRALAREREKGITVEELVEEMRRVKKTHEEEMMEMNQAINTIENELNLQRSESKKKSLIVETLTEQNRILESRLNDAKVFEKENQDIIVSLKNNVLELEDERDNMHRRNERGMIARQSIEAEKMELEKELKQLRLDSSTVSNTPHLAVPKNAEMIRLDDQALEMELEVERLKTSRFLLSSESMKKLIKEQTQMIEMLEKEVLQMREDKMKLVLTTSQQIDQMRSYLVSYQQFAKQ